MEELTISSTCRRTPWVLKLRNFWWTQTATFLLCRNPSNSLLTEMAKAQSSA